jgi:hypothetical protein
LNPTSKAPTETIIVFDKTMGTIGKETTNSGGLIPNTFLIDLRSYASRSALNQADISEPYPLI